MPRAPNTTGTAVATAIALEEVVPVAPPAVSAVPAEVGLVVEAPVVVAPEVTDVVEDVVVDVEDVEFVETPSMELTTPLIVLAWVWSEDISELKLEAAEPVAVESSEESAAMDELSFDSALETSELNCESVERREAISEMVSWRPVAVVVVVPVVVPVVVAVEVAVVVAAAKQIRPKAKS